MNDLLINRALVVFFIFPFFCAFSCKAQKNSADQSKSVIILEGALDIDSEDRMILTYEDDGESKKIQLIPGTDQVKDFTVKEYDRYIYIKNIDESFWVSVRGNYTDSDTSTGPPQFTFRLIILLNEKPETKNILQREE